MSMDSSSPSTAGQGTAADSMTSAFAIKGALRKSMLKTLRGVSDAELQTQSRAVYEHLTTAPFYKSARSIGCYLSMQKGELRTTEIVKDILSSQKKLYTPYLPPEATQPKSTRTTGVDDALVPPPQREIGSENPLMEMLRLYTLDDLAGCPTDRWGILDPGLKRFDGDQGVRENLMDDNTPNVDLILIPGVAFDDDCNRLGRGKAYYDRFLARYTASKPRPLLVALALESQLLPSGDKVPTTPNDFRLDGVISPRGIVWRDGVHPQEMVEREK